MKKIKDNHKGIVYQDDNYKFFYRKKGSISGDNDINSEENIYLVDGAIKLFINDEMKEMTAPQKIYIPEKTYHKIEALTDIIFILLE